MKNHSAFVDSIRRQKIPAWMKKATEVFRKEVWPEMLEVVFEPKQKKAIEEWFKREEQKEDEQKD